MFRIKVDINPENDGHVELLSDSYRKDFEIMIYVTPDTNLSSIFSDRKKLASMVAKESSHQLDEFIAMGLKEDGFFAGKNSFDDFYFMRSGNNPPSASKIEEKLDDQLLFSFYGDGISKYIDDNIEFLNENNVLLPSGSFGIVLDMKALDSVLSKYPNVKNPYILLQGNVSGVPVEGARDTIRYINEICEHVKSLELSPLEEVIYVFDQIRQREYREELDGESYEKSRGLSDVILGNNIVCAGYSNLDITILKKLGHRIEEYPLDSAVGKGHSRVIMKLDDDKYDIHGIFVSDLTWSSKEEKDPEYLNNYNYLLRRPEYFRDADSYFGIYNLLEDPISLDKFLEDYYSEYNVIDYISWSKKYGMLISNIPRLCGDDDLIKFPVGNNPKPSKSELHQRVRDYLVMISKDPDVPQLMSAINRVRDIEQKENPEISSGRETMEKIFDRYDSEFKDHDATMKAVFTGGKARNTP